ncbi:hypothetical protein WOLCODRAFT_152666 [Wolfiporia cocos MD-104 SS10]|uniref:Uncharacterized protein n=1 Tax=Wolfiporia cocos (strain MD-104) TaxID=742152 RepID=A0A2H3JKB5_WOLCO|nr:hypothetical protein WOLCODRAFT_152666 [Wolfiporia cocos MD-104 SS10]
MKEGDTSRRTHYKGASPAKAALPYASEHLAHALGTQAPTANATPAYPHRTPPPARCHIGGVPPERRLLNNRPHRRSLTGHHLRHTAISAVCPRSSVSSTTAHTGVPSQDATSGALPYRRRAHGAASP